MSFDFPAEKLWGRWAQIVGLVAIWSIFQGSGDSVPGPLGMSPVLMWMCWFLKVPPFLDGFRLEAKRKATLFGVAQKQKHKNLGLSECVFSFFSDPEAPGAFNGRPDPSIRHPAGVWDPVSKPSCLRALNTSGASGEKEKQQAWVLICNPTEGTKHGLGDSTDTSKLHLGVSVTIYL